MNIKNIADSIIYSIGLYKTLEFTANKISDIIDKVIENNKEN